MTNITTVSRAFLAARRAKLSLSDYPDAIPSTLDQAYAIQERSIKGYRRLISGWKIGRLSPEAQAIHGTERLAGPIFKSVYKNFDGRILSTPVFKGGFAAVEAEYVFRAKADANPEKFEYSDREALGLVDAVFMGVEMAGSPLATINALGPTVVVSDFGNNNGLILGPKLMDLDESSFAILNDNDALRQFKAETRIDDQIVGKGGLYVMPGGPLAAIGWLAGHLARRNRPLKAGQLISSGATTGIHDIGPNQASVVTFDLLDGTQKSIRLKTV